MEIDRNERVSGQPILRVRNYFRWIGDSLVSRGSIAGWFEVSDRKAAQLLREFRVRGWIVRLKGKFGRQGSYEVTTAGNSLAIARAVPRISREKAERLLLEFLERVASVNGRDELTHYVHEVWVFGSYVNKKAKDLGDIDLGVDLRLRDVPGRDKMKYREERADQSGRRLSWLDRLGYGDNEVRQLLKARSPYISIHPIDDIKATGSRARLIYKVKRGGCQKH